MFFDIWNFNHKMKTESRTRVVKDVDGNDTNESYTNSLIIKSLPNQPVTRSTIIITHIIVNAMNPIIDFSFQLLLSLNISTMLY